MNDYAQPITEIEWSRRAIINAARVLAAHLDALTLIGAHAVLLRTENLAVPQMPTGDGDLGVTPDLVADVPSIGSLMIDAGYEQRTTARPGLWGRTVIEEGDGSRGFREKIDLLAPHSLSGTASRSRRGVPVLQGIHGKLTVGNALGLELASVNRALMTVVDLADPRLTAELHVAEAPALLVAKGSKIGERRTDPRKGTVRDKDLGDLWRLMAIADPPSTMKLFSEYVDDPKIGLGVRQGFQWFEGAVCDPVSRERAKSAFEFLVDPAEIDRVFDRWRDAFPVSSS